METCGQKIPTGPVWPWNVFEEFVLAGWFSFDIWIFERERIHVFGSWEPWSSIKLESTFCLCFRLLDGGESASRGYCQCGRDGSSYSCTWQGGSSIGLFKQRQGLILDQWTRAWVSSMVVLEIYRSLCAFTLWHLYGVGFMQCGNFDWLSGYRWIWQETLPWTAPSTNTWVNQPILPCQRLGCMQGNSMIQRATTGTNLLAEYSYVVVERYWEIRRVFCSEA